MVVSKPTVKIPIWKFQTSATAPNIKGESPGPIMLDMLINTPVNTLRSLRVVIFDMTTSPAG